MKLKEHERVSYEVAKARAIAYLKTVNRLSSPSFVADAIWPNNSFKAQGAGIAGAAILKRMSKEGLVIWESDRIRRSWGWRLL